MTFEAVVETEDEGVFVVVPFDVKAEFGAARAPVTVTIGGFTWDSTIAVYGGRSYLPLRRGVRQAARIEPGDTVTVTVEPR